MSCGCSLCAIRDGASAPKLDGCRCPGQVHVNPNCFVSPPSKEARVSIKELKDAAQAVLDRIEANQIDFSRFGGQDEVNALAALLRGG